MTALRLETCSNGIARLWNDDTVVAIIVGGYDGWTARPHNVSGARGWGFMCPTRRQAVDAVTAWLAERGIA